MTKPFVLAVCFSFVAVSAHAASFTNGSFEVGPNPGVFTTLPGGDTTIPGWTVLGHSIDYIGTYWEAADGVRSLDLNGLGPGGVSQSFDTTLGVLYRVRFALAGNPDGLPDQKIMTVVAGPLVHTVAFDAANTTRQDMGWVYHTLTFVADAPITTLAFLSGTAGNPPQFGPALDDVSVTVPEPVTSLLFGASMTAAAVARHRARRRQA